MKVPNMLCRLSARPLSLSRLQNEGSQPYEGVSKSPVSLSRLQNEGSQLCARAVCGVCKSIKATE